ncbi:hypothetical protein ACFLXN_00775 [Chloroflexota bacterium]
MSSQTADDYIEAFSEKSKTILNDLRHLILSTLPNAVETMRHRMPTYEIG